MNACLKMLNSCYNNSSKGIQMINVENLVKEFPKKDGSKYRAVNDVSFNAVHGEIVCLLGVNWSWKDNYHAHTIHSISAQLRNCGN